MNCRQINTSGNPMTFFLTSSGDPLAGIASEIPTIAISKNGGSFITPSGASGEIGSGWYSLAGHVDDRNTLGEFCIHASSTNSSGFDGRYTIVGYDPFSSTNLGLTDVTAIKTKTDGLNFSGDNVKADLRMIEGVTEIDGSTNLTNWAKKIWIGVYRSFTGSAAGRTKAFKDKDGATDFTHTYSSDGNNSRTTS